ncbi:hypothetical protein PFISCL1PPCAC_6137 [Pristionchus fissidentatus]|uniref:Dolichyl-diphosphooligosaccharide--protein glycosyltransferase 48 kDa subunit n=1 Tax=Pristionchus fissidentatus TaxID=1538716 RepID=A0AAV5V5H4_9BILA|nr:hypothetical protein PFISCL1PPCAC_6137 [Pristionchus fissidentatus]
MKLLLLLLAACAAADRVLVLVDHMGIRESHSIFFKSITDRGHSITFKNADEGSLQLIKFGELQYENLIIFAPSADEFGGTITAAEIARFVDQGGNVLLAGAGSNVGSAVRDVAADNGFEFADQLIDHVNYDSILDDGSHTTIVASPLAQLLNAPMINGDRSKLGPILYSGGALVASPNNRLRLDVFKAPSTAYAHDPSKPIKDYPAAVGRQAVLVSAVQARNNARLVLSASLDLFSNAFITATVNKEGEKPSPSGNKAYVEALSKWVLKETGVLRVKSVEHHKVGEKQPPREYTITEDVDYKLEVEELKDGKWVAFDGKDVQLEFVRIDPFVRTTLKNKNGVLSTRFKLPDVYGVYKFLVDYRRVGYTHLLDIQQVSVRPLWHTQYERFIRSAFPYYASSFSMMGSLVIFSFVFLYHKNDPVVAQTKKNN